MDQMNAPDPQMVNYVMDPHVAIAFACIGFAMVILVLVCAVLAAGK